MAWYGKAVDIMGGLPPDIFRDDYHSHQRGKERDLACGDCHCARLGSLRQGFEATAAVVDSCVTGTIPEDPQHS